MRHRLVLDKVCKEDGDDEEKGSERWPAGARLFLDKRQRDDILGALAEAGLITTAMRQTATRPKMVFCAVEATP